MHGHKNIPSANPLFAGILHVSRIRVKVTSSFIIIIIIYLFIYLLNICVPLRSSILLARSQWLVGTPQFIV